MFFLTGIIAIKRIIKRTFLLIAFGLFVNLLIYPSVGGYRIAGVLQRIAIVYLACSLLFIKTTWKTQMIIGSSILLVYWLILSFIPVPGIGKPSIEPVNNLVSWIDRIFLPGMLYTKNHDPEGILSTLPAIASGISGMLTGIILLKSNDLNRKISKLVIYGFCSLIIGILWSFVFPLNKNLWTSSFVLVTSGAGLILLSFCIWLIDIKNRRTGTFPFLVFGSNAITVYILSFVFLYIVWPPFFGEGKAFIQLCWNFFVGIGFSPKFSSLIWALIYTGLCYIPVYFLYRKKIFFKI